MSIDLLYDHENAVKQTIKDDMESLLYVVLYCALHWLPHSLSKDELITEYNEAGESVSACQRWQLLVQRVVKTLN